MTGSVIANIADYADALLTTRKARNVLVSLLLVMLFFQLALFFAVRYKIQIAPASSADLVGSVAPVTHQTPPVLIDFLKYLTGLVDFAGVIVPFVLAVDLWLIVSIMLMGRLLGVSRLVTALLWCAVLLALLFPWQAFLNNQTFTSTEFKIPGVLYTWTELAVRGRIHPAGVRPSILYWARFVGWPIIAIAIVLTIQHQSRLGLRSVMGKNSSTPAGNPAAES